MSAKHHNVQEALMMMIVYWYLFSNHYTATRWVCRVRVAQCVYIALSGSRSQTYSTSIEQAPFFVLGCVRCMWVCLVYMGVLCVYDVRCVCECVCACV